MFWKVSLTHSFSLDGGDVLDACVARLCICFYIVALMLAFQACKMPSVIQNCVQGIFHLHASTRCICYVCGVYVLNIYTFSQNIKTESMRMNTMRRERGKQLNLLFAYKLIDYDGCDRTCWMNRNTRTTTFLFVQWKCHLKLMHLAHFTHSSSLLVLLLLLFGNILRVRVSLSLSLPIYIFYNTL